jgi:hypothetical protein
MPVIAIVRAVERRFLMMSAIESKAKRGRFWRMVGVISQPLMPSLSPLRGSFHFQMRDLWIKAFSHQKSDALSIEDPSERFAAVMASQGLSSVDLDQRRRALYIQFLCFLGIALISATGVFLHVIFVIGNNGWDLRDMIFQVLLIVFTTLLLAKAMQVAFFNWVLSSRRFSSFSEWLKLPSAWWPKPNKK